MVTAFERMYCEYPDDTHPKVETTICADRIVFERKCSITVVPFSSIGFWTYDYKEGVLYIHVVSGQRFFDERSIGGARDFERKYTAWLKNGNPAEYKIVAK